MLVLHQSLQQAAAPIAGFWLYWSEYTVTVWAQGSVYIAGFEDIDGAEFERVS